MRLNLGPVYLFVVPATFAHPVFAVPLRRMGLPLSALCIGAMVPDLAYVLGWGGLYTGHSLYGMGLFSLPVGMAAWVVFHTLVKPAVLFAVPRPWAERLSAICVSPDWHRARVWGIGMLAVWLSAGTHVGVDEFTHAYGWAAQTWPDIFARPRWPSPFGLLPLYKVLQYGLGVGGTAVLAMGVFRWYRRGPRRRFDLDDRRRLWRLIFVGTGLVSAAMLRAGFVAWSDPRGPMHVFMVQTAAGGMVGLMGVLVFLGVVYRIHLRRAKRG